MDNQYFSRTACWSHINDCLVIHDSFSLSAPRIITMEPWHEVVFMAADGEHTISEFVATMASQYDDGEPDGLRHQVHEIIKALIAENILQIHEQPKVLPPYFAEPHNAVSPEIRKSQMQVDGLID